MKKITRMCVFRLTSLERSVKPYDLVSFDVFDTVVFRSLLSQYGVQKVTAQLLLYGLGLIPTPTAIEEHLAARRKVIQALKESKDYPTQEPNLFEINKALLLGYATDEAIIDELASSITAVEVDLEAASLKRSRSVDRLIDQMVKNQQRLVLLSDMYLDGSAIRSILRKVESAASDLEVLVSSDTKFTKATGDAYTYLADRVNLRPSQIVHVGDSLTSDVFRARSKGFHSIWFLGTKLERLIETNCGSQGARNFSRLNLDELMAGFAFGFLASLVSFVLNSGLQRVFFCSRDATGFKELLSSLLASNYVLERAMKGVELRELCVSRVSLAFLNLPDRPVNADVLNLYRQYVDGDATEVEICSFFERTSAKSSRVVTDDIVKLAKQHQSLAIDYLRSVGLLDEDVEACVVDIGYQGTSSRVINEFLASDSEDKCSQSNLKTFLVCRKMSNKDATKFGVEGYLRTSHLPSILRLNFSWLEVFFQDQTRGPLLGYQSKRGSPIAVFQEGSTTERSDVCAVMLNSKPHLSHILPPFTAFFDEDLAQSFVGVVVSRLASPNPMDVDQVRKRVFAKGKFDQSLESIVVERFPTRIVLSPRSLRWLIKNDVWLAGSCAAHNSKFNYHLVRVQARCYIFMLTLRQMLRGEAQ